MSHRFGSVGVPSVADATAAAGRGEPAPLAARAPVPGRVAALDALRGLIMLLMAVDHASYFIAKVHPGEFWGTPLPRYPDGLAFFTRFITHFCAPGFFFLLGVSVTLFAESRRLIGYSERRIVRHLLTRGALLIVLEHVLENPAWLLGALGSAVPIETHGGSGPPGGGSSIRLAFLVLYGLGSAMIACALLSRLGTRTIVALAAAAILGTQLLLPGPEQVATRYHALLRLLLIPGQTGTLLVAYPALPWVGIAGLGLAFGRVLLDDPPRAGHMARSAGLAALVMFAALRAAGGRGDFHQISEPGLIGFLNLTKYPPSLAFTLLTVGANLVVLAALLRAADTLQRWGRPLVVLGGSALFFYFAHLYLYALIGFAFPRGTSLAAMYALWATGIVALYPATAWYGRFKRRRPPDSPWRFF
jgi:uncharacterized membrane protein